MQFILYLPDSAKAMSTPVDQTPPQGREEWVDNNNLEAVNDSAERGDHWAPDYLRRTLIKSKCCSERMSVSAKPMR